MKQECPTYFKIIGKSKVLAATLSDTESKDDFDYKDNEILNTFIATVNPTEGIVEDADEEEEFVESRWHPHNLCKVIQGLRKAWEDV